MNWGSGQCCRHVGVQEEAVIITLHMYLKTVRKSQDYLCCQKNLLHEFL